MCVLVALKIIAKFVRETWMILGISMLVFIAIESGLSLAFYLRGFWHTPYVDFRIKADTYTDTSWVDQYFQEHEHLGKPRWRSYAYWRRPQHSGKYINIDSEGIRKTSNAIMPEEGGTVTKVFMFGGSTIFGSGERDEYTIPSIFARETRNKGINCEVVNFGQEAYVSTQEVIELMLQLQRGNIPDVVIFYDGANDTHSASQMSTAGLPFNEFKREKEFNISENREIRSLAAQYSIKELWTVRFFNGLLKTLGLREDSNTFNQILEYEKPASDRETLARNVVEIYLNNIKMVRALSKSYGFECLFYWQPIIDQKQQLTEYERKVLELDFNYVSMKELYAVTYAFLQKRTVDLKDEIDFHDLGSIFRDVSEPIFVDYCHLGEKGNGLIAKKMVEDFAQLSSRRGFKNRQVEQ